MKTTEAIKQAEKIYKEITGRIVMGGAGTEPAQVLAMIVIAEFLVKHED